MTRKQRAVTVLAEECAGAPDLPALLGRCLAARRFERRLAAELADVAAGRRGASWEGRRLAAHMLHRQALLIPRHDLEAHGALFACLGLQDRRHGRLAEWLLAEGFTTTEPRAFVREFRAWLSRGRGAFRRLGASGASPEALRAFAAGARRECRLPLARYLFSPAEVVERIAAQVRRSRGVESPLQLAGEAAGAEGERALSRLPPFEAGIARALCRESLVYWVADGTPSRFNSLVAQPPATVALVVRPPGSCHELELKRSGCRGPHPWELIVRQDGEDLPFARRFSGASILKSLQTEARGCSRLAALFRRAHAAEAPLGPTLALATVYGVPSAAGEQHVLDYFSQPAAFGASYPRMRQAMRDILAVFRPSWRAELGGDLGLTLQFLHHYPPGQSIVSGTSSLRLDRAARYLGGDAAAAEREHGAGTEEAGLHGKARHTQELTDEMLDEVLGLYTPPRVPYRSQRRYVAAAFAVPANRARADRAYGDVMRELGRLWGTLLAVRGWSGGESFVGRNVGLRSCWEGGRWRVRIVSMDHDGLTVPGPRDALFHPLDALPGMELDEKHILWKKRPIGAAQFLARIYHVGRAGALAGRAGLRRAAARAYRRTQAAMRRDPDLETQVHPDFVRRLGDWDEVVRLLLARPRRESRAEPSAALADAVRHLLAGKGYGHELIEEHVTALQGHAAALRRLAFVYGAPGAGRRP